jgi:hypothetical protein
MAGSRRGDGEKLMATMFVRRRTGGRATEPTTCIGAQRVGFVEQPEFEQKARLEEGARRRRRPERAKGGNTLMQRDKRGKEAWCGSSGSVSWRQERAGGLVPEKENDKGVLGKRW